jgi:transposase-like protein
MILINSSLPAFLNTYGTDEACLQAIFDIKWPRGFVCPDCAHNDGYRLTTRPRVVQCASCRGQTSITADTIFQDSHMALPMWFLAIYLVANDKGGISALRLAKEVGVRRTTAHRMLQKIRFAMGGRDENLTLAGYIELDEAFFGGRSPTKSHGKSPFDGKVQVLVMVESENMAAGNLVMKVIPDTKMETLQQVVAKNVDDEPAGHCFRTDALGRHHGIRSLGHYVNMAVMTKAELNTQMACLSLAISHVKRFFKGTYHHFCKLHIQNYLDEFCYRWNRRHLEKQLTSHLIAACVLHPAVTAKVLKIRPPLMAAA